MTLCHRQSVSLLIHAFSDFLESLCVSALSQVLGVQAFMGHRPQGEKEAVSIEAK